MKIKQYAGVLVMTLAVTAQTAYAAVVMQIDITAPNNVKFIATDAKSQIDDSGSYSHDGITLKNILPPESDVEASMTGDLAAFASWTSINSVAYDAFEVEPTADPELFDLHIYPNRRSGRSGRTDKPIRSGR